MASATDLLRQDHMRVKELFRQFESTEDARERKAIADTALVELDVHARLEEEIFYPSVRRMVKGEREFDELMNEAEEEHHVAEMLIQELTTMQPDNPEFSAKFTVLAESVQHHIEEEESEMLPQAEELGPEKLEQLGSQMEQRKQELLSGSNGRSGSRSRPAAGATRTRAGGARRTKTGKPTPARSGSRSGSGSRSRGKSRSK